MKNEIILRQSKNQPNVEVSMISQDRHFKKNSIRYWQPTVR